MCLRHKYLLSSIIVIFALLVIFLLWSRIATELFTLKAAEGVTLANIDVGGCQSDEIVEVVDELAKLHQREAINAQLDADTQSLIPEINGFHIDCQKTVAEVLHAPANQKIKLSKVFYAPEITSSQSPQAVIYQGNPQKHEVALMVNVDWGLPEPLLSFLEVFRDHHVHVTFCMTGRVIDKFPETVSAIINNGHEIASHGYYHHSAKYNYYDMSVADITQELTSTDEALARISSYQMKIFSPPSGIVTPAIQEAAAANNYRTVMWTPGLDTIDWQEPLPEVILRRIQKGLVSGGIILMHPKEQSLEALPAIIEYIESQGFAIVPVGQLISPYLASDYQYMKEVKVPCE